MLVSMAVFVLMLVIVAGVTNQASSTVRSGSAMIDAFQAGRGGFDIITRNLSEATLGTYWDYDDPTHPAKYIRKSDLHFVTRGNGGSQEFFFQSPRAVSRVSAYQNTKGLLNALGYFVEYGNDDAFRPAHVKDKRWRYRLMQGLQPAEDLEVFQDSTAAWTTAVKNEAWPISDNVIAMIIWPRLSEEVDPGGTLLSTDYQYDSRTGTAIQQAQLPPVVRVTLVIIDESSAARLDSGETPPAAIQGALAGKFSQVANYSTDLQNLERALSDANIKYQVLTMPVSLRESKWSSTP